MKFPLCLVLTVLLCGILAAGGCTTAPASPGTAAPTVPATHVPAVPLSSLVLLRTDLPDGYLMTTNQEKNASEMGSLAKDLGWQAGYVAEFTGTADVPENMQNIVRQSLATYPEGSMASIIASVNRTDQSYTDLRYYDFPISGLGANARGFAANVGNSTPPGASATTGSLPGVVDLGGETSENTLGQSIAEVIFSKGTTLEVIRITGPAPNPDDVLAIARKAYSKIP